MEENNERDDWYDIGRCPDCGEESPEIFVVHDELWEGARYKQEDYPCRPCFEKTIGRKLLETDFKGASGNLHWPECSEWIPLCLDCGEADEQLEYCSVDVCPNCLVERMYSDRVQRILEDCYVFRADAYGLVTCFAEVILGVNEDTPRYGPAPAAKSIGKA